MIDERSLLLRAFDALSISAVHGPGDRNRVVVELNGDGFLDLGLAGTPAADAALEWRSFMLVRWLDSKN